MQQVVDELDDETVPLCDREQSCGLFERRSSRATANNAGVHKQRADNAMDAVEARAREDVERSTPRPRCAWWTMHSRVWWCASTGILRVMISKTFEIVIADE